MIKQPVLVAGARTPIGKLLGGLAPLAAPALAGAAIAATAVVRQISLYPYPELPAYQGSGNVDTASSYVGRVSPALEKPVRWLGKFNRAMIWCNSQGTDCKEVKDKVEA